MSPILAGSAYALVALGVMALFIVLDGAWTTRIYRGGGLHRLLTRAPRVADVPLAMASTFCSCMTQAPVATWAQGGADMRAARWLGWASTLRPMAIVGLLLLSWKAALGFTCVALAYGVVAGRLLGAISPGATFLVRRPSPMGDWLGDAVREAGRMLRAYAPVLVGCAVLGGVVWVLPLRLPPAAGWFGLLGVFVPVDLLAAMPVLVALGMHGAPTALVAGLGAGALTCAWRAERLLRGYLRVEAYGRQRALARAFPLVVTLVTLATS